MRHSNYLDREKSKILIGWFLDGTNLLQMVKLILTKFANKDFLTVKYD